MKIKVHKSHGSYTIDAFEVEILVQEQLKMVPGIVELADNGLKNKIKLLMNKNSHKSVIVYPLSNKRVGITCRVKIVDGVNFKEVSHEAQNIIKFSVEKKYGLKVDCVDIIIDGFIRR